MSERRFPVLLGYHEQMAHPDLPRSVPWSLLAPHEDQALRNHCGQTLEVLASRGGLGAEEMWSVVHDRRYRDNPGADACYEWLRSVA